MRTRTLAALVALGVAIGSCVDAVAPPDSISPPGGVTVTLVGTSSARVTWNAPQEAEFVDSYNVFRDGAKIGESITTSYLDNNLAQGVTYKYRVSANGQRGIVGLLSEESAAATLTVPDVTPPTVTSTNPAPGTLGIPLGSKVSVTFSEPMDPATITTASFFLKTSGGALIPATVSYDAPTRTAQLTPTGALPNTATVSATVTTGVKDVPGNSLASDFTFSFTMRDEAPPSVVSTSPVNGATGVSVTAPVSVTFNEPIDPATLNASSFTLATTLGGATVTGNVSYDVATRTGTFTPSAPLAGSTGYTATVAGTVKDQAFNAMGTPFSFSFTTADITPPTVVSVSPGNNATDVLAGAAISVTFSEAMDAATINGSTVALRLTSSGAFVAGAVSYNAATMTASLTPSANLAFATGYTVVVTTGARDVAGNQLASAFSSVFVTTSAPDTIAPTVLSVSPADGAAGVAITEVVRVTFSEAMNPATINGTTLTLKNLATSAVFPATVAYDAGAKTATLTPSSTLAFGTAYGLTVSGGASDLAGNGLAGVFVSSFTTTAAPDVTPPTVLSTVPAHDAANVSVLTPITVTFSEAMNPATINGSTITLRVTATSSPVSGTVTYNAATNTAAFSPSAQLTGSTGYTLAVTTGVRDLAGNALASPFTASFTTGDTTPPGVVSTSPANGAVGVLISSTVTVTFSEAMKASTINSGSITLQNTTTGTPVAGSVSYDAGTRTATFIPSAPLFYNSGHTLTVTTAATDVAGNGLASNFTATFKSIQYVFSRPYFQGTNEITDPSQPQIHVHLRFTQDGHTLGRPADCEPLPDANCDLLPRNQAGADAIGPLDDAQGGTIGIAATVTQITGTFTDPGISFTITLQNGRTFSFTGTVENSQTMRLTMSGATLPAPIAIVLDRFATSGGVSATRGQDTGGPPHQ